MLSFFRSLLSTWLECREITLRARRVRITQGAWKDEEGEVLATYPNEARSNFDYYYLVKLESESSPMAFTWDEVEMLPAPANAAP